MNVSTSISGQLIEGPLYNIYNAYILTLYLAFVVVAIKKLRVLDGVLKINVAWIFWSVIIAGLPALIIDVVIPMISDSIKPNTLYSNILTIIWLGVMAKIVIQKDHKKELK